MASFIKTLFMDQAKTNILYPRTKTKAVFDDNGVDLDTRLANSGVDIGTIYPVGSIYMTAASTNPGTLFPGTTWEQIKDRFLLAAGDTYAAGSTGGEASVTLTTNELPSHSHSYTTRGSMIDADCYKGSYLNATTSTPNTGNAGGGQAHNNMPPYLAVYIWKRVS